MTLRLAGSLRERTPCVVPALLMVSRECMVEWAKNRISLPYAKSGRQKRPPWSRMAEAKVREDDHHDPTASVISAARFGTVRALRAYFL